MLYAFLERAALEFGRLLQAMPVNVVQPAVEWAADAAIFDAAVGQRGQPMGAVQTDEPGSTLVVAEEDEILPEETDRPRFAACFDFRGDGDRLPVATHVVAALRAGVGAADQLVLLRGQHTQGPPQSTVGRTYRNGGLVSNRVVFPYSG
ncbi:MAG: hypothetical protein HW416_2561 [Chloroflexi bacterium]|nr:hypothetical protein [Chloroflexota bacterium]